MHIERFRYAEFEGQPKEWSLDEVVIGSTTLIVGRNAAGKSRTLNLIGGLASILAADRKPSFTSANYCFTFRDGNTKYEYELIIVKAAVTHERFLRDGVELLTRGPNGVGKIWAEKSKQHLEFQAPISEVAAVTRRDSIQHPFFDSLYLWGKGMRHFHFGTPLGKDSFAVFVKGKDIEHDPKDTSAAIATFRKGEKEHGQKFIDAILADMALVDYHLDKIGLGPPNSVAFQGPLSASDVVGLYAKETKLQGITEQHDMSQGMFRALSVIVQINYAYFAKTPTCILVDDIGEGLDFERSCALVKLLVEKEKSSGVQLIMSTNDRFVMNSVPLEHWAVLVRNGGKAKLYNYANSKAKFDDFKFTGLNNFDFFATDFINTKTAPNEETRDLR